MAITWILVCQRQPCETLRKPGPQQGSQAGEGTGPSRESPKNAELVTDKIGTGNGNSSYEPASQPKEQAARSFAHQIAKELYAGRSRNEFERAILVAPPSFMGMLNSNLDGPTSQLVSDRFEKDYTKTSEPALVAHLSSCIFL